MTEPLPEDAPVDLRHLNLDALERYLSEWRESNRESLLVRGQGEDFWGMGLSVSIKMKIEGNLGDYCLLGNRGTQVEVDGNVGNCACQAFERGSIVVRGSAGDAFGCFGKGGFVAVYGSAGWRCAGGLENGEVIVRGNVGSEAGYRMRGGTLIIGGSALGGLGSDMTGGTIYLRGDVAGLHSGIEEVRLKESDRFKLGLVLLKAGIKANGKDFRAFRRMDS